MELILNLYKERGETPLARIDRYRLAHPEYKNVPMSYVGRLDPMAEGVLVVLVGEENKRRNDYLGLEKSYTYDVLFGFATDTYDILGLLTDTVSRASHRRINTGMLMEYVSQMVGTHEQKYPPYSSKPLDGVPLFVRARKGELGTFELPTHAIKISQAALVGVRRAKEEDLLTEIVSNLKRVHGDFRQKQIISVWEDHLRVLYGLEFEIATISVTCSTGTYVRSLANELGGQMGVPALAYKILRTQVGKWRIKDAGRE